MSNISRKKIDLKQPLFNIATSDFVKSFIKSVKIFPKILLASLVLVKFLSYNNLKELWNNVLGDMQK